eukprot:418507-Pelagomonas_calceolata.AAC.2
MEAEKPCTAHRRVARTADWSIGFQACTSHTGQQTKSLFAAQQERSSYLRKTCIRSFTSDEYKACSHTSQSF